MTWMSIGRWMRTTCWRSMPNRVNTSKGSVSFFVPPAPSPAEQITKTAGEGTGGTETGEQLNDLARFVGSAPRTVAGIPQIRVRSADPTRLNDPARFVGSALGLRTCRIATDSGSLSPGTPGERVGVRGRFFPMCETFPSPYRLTCVQGRGKNSQAPRRTLRNLNRLIVQGQLAKVRRLWG